MFNKNTLYFHLMTEEYFDIYQNLDEFQTDPNRGHGVMIIDINNLLVAVPLRSKIKPYMKKSNHLFPYETYIDENTNQTFLKALDFSKLTIIQEEFVNKQTTYIFNNEEEKKYYTNNFNRLYTRINNYISTYQKICLQISNQEDVKRYTLSPYRYSTLRNFHNELNISISKEDFVKVLKEKFD